MVTTSEDLLDTTWSRIARACAAKIEDMNLPLAWRNADIWHGKIDWPRSMWKVKLYCFCDATIFMPRRSTWLDGTRYLSPQWSLYTSTMMGLLRLSLPVLELTWASIGGMPSTQLFQPYYLESTLPRPSEEDMTERKNALQGEQNRVISKHRWWRMV